MEPNLRHVARKKISVCMARESGGCLVAAQVANPLEDLGLPMKSPIFLHRNKVSCQFPKQKQFTKLFSKVFDNTNSACVLGLTLHLFCPLIYVIFD